MLRNLFTLIVVLTFSGCATQSAKPRDNYNQLLESAGQFLDSILVYTLNH
jgi:hypothetical protein